MPILFRHDADFNPYALHFIFVALKSYKNIKGPKVIIHFRFGIATCRQLSLKICGQLCDLSRHEKDIPTDGHNVHHTNMTVCCRPPYTPLLYIKLGFTGVFIIFSFFFALKHMHYGYSFRTPVLTYTHNIYVFSKIRKIPL